MNINQETLKRIDIPLLLNRLDQSGWIRLKGKGMFRSPSGDIFHVPARIDSELDSISLESVIRELMLIERLSTVDDLISRIQGSKEDLVMFGVELADSTSGMIPLTLAPGFYDALRRFFASTIAQSLGRFNQSDSPRNPRSTYLRSIKLSRSEAGSYMVALHLPIDTIPTPTGRTVATFLSYAFDDLEKAIDEESPEPLLANNWSGKMCDTFIAFGELRGVTAVKMRLLPDPFWNLPNRLIGKAFEIDVSNEKSTRILQSAARILYDVRDESEVVVIGTPFELRDSVFIGENNMRRITVAWDRPGKQAMRVQILVDDAGYEIAHQAIGKGTIEARGQLKQKGSRWELIPSEPLRLTGTLVTRETVDYELSSELEEWAINESQANE